jgi:hypothetical protein
LKVKIGNLVNAAALIYLIIPIIIFAFGWLKIGYACTVTAVLCTALFFSLKDMTLVEIHFDKKQAYNLLIAIVLVVIWVGLSGIGGFSFQNTDHEVRNAVFRDLVQLPWPVVYHYTGEQNVLALAGHDGALAYYVAYWLPAALAGKMFGWGAANLVLYLWTVLGVLLCLYYFSFFVRKKFSLIVVGFFILWSGLDALGVLLRRYPFAIGAHIEWWAIYFQYSSNTTALYWVFNQTIIPWLVVMLLLNQTNNRNILFLFALCVPYAPLPSIGLIPFILYWSLFRRTGSISETSHPHAQLLRRLHALWQQVRPMLTFQNIAVPLILGVLFSSYFMVNSYIGNHYHGLIMLNVSYPANLLWCYFLFCTMEFGLYALIIFPSYKKDQLFLIAVLSLVLIPWYYAGVNNDFVMRASIPPLVILMTFVLRFLFDEQNQIARLIVVILFGIGAITPLNEIYRSLQITFHDYPHRHADNIQSMSSFKFIEDVGPFVAIDPEKSFFFKYFGKPISSTNTNNQK